MAAAEVRDVTMADRVEWDRLWAANCAHYGASPSAAENDELWRRIVDPDFAMGALIGFRSDASPSDAGISGAGGSVADRSDAAGSHAAGSHAARSHAASPIGSASPIGFAHYVLHPHTFSARMVCYLEDLWVEPAARGGGVGRSLIETLIARGRQRGWRRLYWHTEADNVAARALYDRIAGVTDYIRYDVALQ